jgi:hypothetical protein
MFKISVDLHPQLFQVIPICLLPKKHFIRKTIKRIFFQLASGSFILLDSNIYKSENLSLRIINMLHTKVPTPCEGRRSG